ncbi:hypothetical protein BO71DRAFT_397538 [Aspergillus ellipticus CBS 707.79]|uniref:Uncharacterized protein n=1 Tax=Aspergillus ellipticus CBS 707.79 TaxID=1448320 RepID=A0A319DFD6_9EURO|nr:hypothetical protein BO71DRAFT_397538 [Aspergillus ellipticus CBS 707.79]
MCKRTYNITTRACRHKVETPGSLIPDDGCNNCGTEKGRNNNIASTTSHIPCDDCMAKGLWAQTTDGKWYDVATGGPQQFTADFKFPCQFSM